MITKSELDKLVNKYETIDFIKDDPIQFPHRYNLKEEIEIAGFISSLFAYGNRKLFIKKLEDIFAITDNDLLGFVKNGDFKLLSGIEYRFSKDYDIIPIFEILNKLYTNNSSLENLFEYGYDQDKSILTMLKVVVDYFYSQAPKTAGMGFYHMIPNPNNGGAMKRMNMLMRWFVRKSEVDFGIWGFVEPSELLMPLDVHVARMSRSMGLLNRKSNDFKAVLELTNNLKKYCKEDPIKYDFALFAFGVELNKNSLKSGGNNE